MNSASMTNIHLAAFGFLLVLVGQYVTCVICAVEASYDGSALKEACPAASGRPENAKQDCPELPDYEKVRNHPDVPKRDYMDEPGTTWMDGFPPNFDMVNKKYLAERTRLHAPGSLEKIVENLVKTWEVESTHKIKAEDWRTVNHDRYLFRTNGKFPQTLADNIVRGNYIMMLEDSPLFDVSKETKDSSLKLFKNTFPDGFPWELLDLYSGPPNVTFTWRHWAHWTGPYKGNPPTGELMEMFGSAAVEVDENLKVVDLQVFFDPNPFLAKLMRKRDLTLDEAQAGRQCPFIH